MGWETQTTAHQQTHPLLTPVHIQPQWYFQFAYDVRSIPNKLGGVIALVISIAILFTIETTN